MTTWAMSPRTTISGRFGFGTGLPYTDIIGREREVVTAFTGRDASFPHPSDRTK